MANNDNIIYGKRVNVPESNESLGIRLHKALKDNKEAALFTDALSNEVVTNKTVYTNSCRLGQSLRNVGLVKGNVIAVCSENSLQLFDPVLAALYSGIVVSMFNPHYTEGEFIHVANISQPSIIFCSVQGCSVALKVKDRLNKVPKLIIIDQEEDYKGCQSIRNFISENVSKQFDVNQFAPFPVNVKNDVAFILHSSGTTGLPKGVMLTHLNYNTSIDIYNSTDQPQEGTSLLVVPLHHAYGLFLACRKIISGGRIVLMKKFDPNVYLRTIQNYKISHLMIVPSIASFLAKSELVKQYDLSSVEKIRCGAAPLGKNIEESLMKRFNLSDIRQGYGMTEATIGIIIPSYEEPHVFGSSGYVFPNMAVKIIDIHTGKSVGPMKTGELLFRGNVVMKGYYNDPDATRNIIDEDGWLHTGDVAYYDSNQRFYIVDRLKELIKCKGLQVAPAELEAVLMTHPKIADAGVIGIPDDRDGEVPFAFVVKNEALREKEVEDYVAERVSSYKRLKGVRFVSQIPRNPGGKILRRHLRQQVTMHKSNL